LPGDCKGLPSHKNGQFDTSTQLSEILAGHQDA
jgi:hypothetical protein